MKKLIICLTLCSLLHNTFARKIAKNNQNIPLPGSTTRTYGDAPFDLPPITDVGLAILYTSSDTSIAKVTGHTVTILQAGTVVFTATQPGDENNFPAPVVTETFTIKKMGQSVNFATLANKTYGDTPFTISATSTSGLPVTWSSSNTAVASIAGTTVTISAAGTVTITASQHGNVNYDSASVVTRTLVIAKADQQINFTGAPEKIYGDPPFTLSAMATSGLPVTFICTDPTIATILNNVVTIKRAGLAYIAAVQNGSANYNDVPLNFLPFTIAKASQSITVLDSIPDKSVADPPFILHATSSSGLPVSFFTDSQIARINGDTITIVGGGSAQIEALQAGDENYAPADYVTRSLIVEKKSQKITFPPITERQAGDPALILSASSDSGLPVLYSSQDSDVVSISGDTVSILKAGTATILASQAGNNLYESASAVQGLVVTIPWTIVFSPVPDKTFGDQAFTLTATSTSGLTVRFRSTSSTISLDSNKVTMLAPGGAVVTAYQPADSIHAEISADQHFCVNPATPAITDKPTQSGSITLISSAPADNQWFLNGSLLVNRTGNTLEAEASGIYTVQTSADHCLSKVSDGYAAVVTGDIKVPGEEISLYPNPADRTIEIKGLSGPIDASFATDLLGRTVSVVFQQNTSFVTGDIQSLIPGLYLIRITSQGKTHSLKFIKQ